MSSSTIERARSLALKVDAADHALRRLNLVLGPVGVGKSAIHDAIQFAALGYVPRIGKAAAFTARLMRGPRAESELAIRHEGQLVTAFRRLHNDGKSLTGDAAASWLPKGTNATNAGEAIRMLCGATEAEAEQNLDIGRLLSAQSGELAATVERLLDAAGMDAAEVRTFVETTFRGRVQNLRPNRDGILGDLPSEVAASLETVLRATLERASRSLLDAKAWATEARIQADAAVRQKRAAGRDAEERLGQLRTPAEAEATLRERREAKGAERSGLSERLRIYRDGTATRDRLASELATARTGVELATEALAARRTAAERLPALREKLAGLVVPAAPVPSAPLAVDTRLVDAETAPLRAKLEEIVDPAGPSLAQEISPDAADLARSDALKAEAEALTRRADAVAKTVVPDVSDAERRDADARRALASAQEEPWREVETTVRDIVRFLGRDGEDAPADEAMIGFDRLLTLAREHGGDVEALRGAVNEAAEALRIAREAADRAREARAAEDAEEARLRTAAGGKIAESIRGRTDAEDAAKEANRAARERFNDACAAFNDALRANDAARSQIRADIDAVKKRHADAVETANRNAHEAYRTAATAHAKIEADVNAQRRAVSAEIDDLDAALRRAERMERDAQAALQRAQAAVDGMAGALQLDQAETEDHVARLDREIEALDADLRAFGTLNIEHDTLSRLVREAEAADGLRNLYAAAEWAIDKAREQDIRRRAGALEEPMRRFLAPAGIEAEPTVRAEKGRVQLGLRYGERFVDASALSGGQSALFRAALGYAVLSARKPILRVLHIEMAEACDGDLEDRILRACEAVQDDVQVIVTTCVPIVEPDAARGWNVIRIDRAAEVAHV